MNREASVTERPDTPEFLSGGGEMGERMRGHDWSTSPLGHPATWSQSLRAVVALMINSKYPMFVAWGPELAFLYNDGYIPIFGAKHPYTLGLPFKQVWPEIWDDIWPLVERALGGEATFDEDLHLVMERHGYPEDTWYSFSYSPVRDEGGAIAGMFCACTETTQKVLAERSLRESETHLAAVIGQTTAGLAETDLSGQFVSVNDRYCKIAGRSREELMALRIQDITHPDDLAGNDRQFERLVKEGEPFEIEKRYLKPDGSTVWVNNNVSLVRQEGREPIVLAAVIDITGRKQSEEALREQAEELQTILDSVPAAIWVARDPACLKISGNARAREILRMSDGAQMSKSAPDAPSHFRIFGPDGDELEAGQMPVQVAANGKNVRHFEERLEFDDGTSIHLFGNATPLFDHEGKVRGAVAAFVDVTDNKRAEQALRDESQTLEMLNRSGAALAAELDLESVVQLVTDAGVELTGAQFGAFFYNVRDEAGESYLLYALSGVDRSAFSKFPMPRNTEVFAPTFEGTDVVRSDNITRDPRYGKNRPNEGMPEGHLPVVSYLAVPVISRSGEVIGGLFFGHPEEARFSERHERLMLAIASQAAVAMDNARLYQAVQRSNETLEQRVEERTSELEKANEALWHAQKMEAIGQLTGGIAHDFNNMLTVIKGAADLLQRGQLDEPKRRRYIDAIADTADRAASLTSQLLAFARRQTLKPETFDATERVRATAEMLGTVLGSRIELRIEAECEDCFVKADAAQFDTALLNMTVNARDTMDGAGILMICIGRAEDIPSGSADPPPGGFVALEVTDTGRGIAPDVLGKIFEPFFTTKEVGKGTGLGLSQVYGFAKQSGGEIEVRSEVGKGATFTLYLPSVPAGQRAGDPADEPSRLTRAEGCVLVVEDNPEVGMFAEHALADLGFETRRATTASEALALLDAGGSFDVVFSDIVMPGDSGIDLAREIRKRWPSLPVVLTTGYSDVLATQHEHSFSVLLKPYSLEELEAALGEALKV